MENDIIEEVNQRNPGTPGGRPGTPKTGGRQKGTPNKVTKSLRRTLEKIVNRNARTIQRDLDALEPKDRLLLLEKFMQYIVPKQSAIKAEISDLSPEDVEAVTATLLDSLKADENN